MSVAEPDVALIAPGTRAEVRLDAYPEAAFPAHFDTASPVASGGDGGARTFSARFRLESDERSLLPDLSAAVDVALSTAGPVVAVPRAAVRYRQGRPYVILAGPRARDRTGPRFRRLVPRSGLGPRARRRGQPMSVRRVLKRAAAVATILVLPTGAFCGLRYLRRADAAATLPVAPARRGDFAVIIRARGQLGARRSVQIAAPRNIQELRIVWLAAPSSPAKAGDVVVRFDPSSAQRQLNENLAALRQAQAALDQAAAQARITAEQDQLDRATARYQVERSKLEASKQAIVSVLQGEASKIDLATAEEKLRVQEAVIDLHRKSDEARIASTTRQRDKAEADVTLTKQRLDEMDVKTPLAGVVSYTMNQTQGWMNARPFRAGDQVWPGAVVAEIPDPATLQMEGKLDEVDRGRIDLGDEVRVHVDAFPERVFSGKVAAVSPLTEMIFEWPFSRQFLIYAPIGNPAPRLRSKMNGGMDIVIRRIPDAISVPAKAVFTLGGKPVVYVAGAKGYRRVEVEVLARNPDEVAVRGIPPDASVTLAEPEAVKEGGRP